MEGQTLVYLLCAKIAATAKFVESEMGALRAEMWIFSLLFALFFPLLFSSAESGRHSTVVTIIFAL
jgi:hypothetical protein